MTVEQSRSPLFEGISPESRAAMKACFDVREQRFRADEVIYDFAARRDIIGILAEGSAVVERIDRQGGRTILEHLESGGVFGEMLMFENVAGDSITVVAQRPCRVWFMAASQVTKRCENACAHHSRMVENMFRLVADKASISSLNAAVARIGTLESNQITTSYLQANYCEINGATINGIKADVANISKLFSGETYTGLISTPSLYVNGAQYVGTVIRYKNENGVTTSKRVLAAT